VAITTTYNSCRFSLRTNLIKRRIFPAGLLNDPSLTVVMLCLANTEASIIDSVANNVYFPGTPRFLPWVASSYKSVHWKVSMSLFNPSHTRYRRRVVILSMTRYFQTCNMVDNCKYNSLLYNIKQNILWSLAHLHNITKYLKFHQLWDLPGPSWCVITLKYYHWILLRENLLPTVLVWRIFWFFACASADTYYTCLYPPMETIRSLGISSKLGVKYWLYSLSCSFR